MTDDCLLHREEFLEVPEESIGEFAPTKTMDKRTMQDMFTIGKNLMDIGIVGQSIASDVSKMSHLS